MLVSLDQETVIRSAFEMPSLPQSTVRLAALIAQDDIELGQVVEVIECDPALTIKLLRVANSIYSSSSRHIGTVKDAIIRLGNGAILGLAVGSCVQPIILNVIPGYGYCGSDFWKHSLAAALATESLRGFTKLRVGPLAFTAALLHDIGKLVLGKFLDHDALAVLELENQTRHIEPFRAELELLSLHHGEVGGLVAQHWGLPDAIVKGILFHHDPQRSGEVISYVTHFANHIAHEVVPMTGFGGSETLPDKQQTVREDLWHLGLYEGHVSSITKAVQERLTAMAADYAK